MLGYTIVEVLVFLAITAFLFLGVATTVGGRQQTVQFNESLRDAQNKLQGVIGQVSSGYVPDSNQLRCTVPAEIPVLEEVSGTVGTNGECVFLGKVVWMDDADPESLSVISVAGRRTKSVSGFKTDAISLQESNPVAIMPGISSQIDSPDLTEILAFNYGLRATQIRLKDDPMATEYGAIFIYSSFPNAGGAGPLVSGSQHLEFGVLQKTDTEDKEEMVAAIKNTTLLTTGAAVSKGIIVCLSDEGGTKKGMVTLGAGGSQTVTLDVDTYDEGVCTV